MLRVIGCVTVDDDGAPAIASTICEPDWPALSVNPRDVPLCVEETTLYSAELAIQDETCCVRTEV
jgi:hypothetical protein